jgi:uncharacterized membrane protein YbhN (UPF0104 family)
MDEFSPPSSRLATFVRAAGTIATLGLLIYLLGQQGWQEVLAGLRQITLWRIIVALILILVSRLAVTARWHVLLKSAGLPITFFKSLRITFAGLFATNFLPTTIGGDVVRLAGSAQLRYDAAVCAASLIVDRLIGIAGMAMFLPFSLPGFIQMRQYGERIPLFAMTFTILKTGRLWDGLREKGKNAFKRIIAATKMWIKHPRSLFLSLAWSWVHMLCLFGTLRLLLAGLGESIPFLLISGLYTLVYFFTLIPVSINGYGLQEISMTIVLTKLGGASMSSSLTAALIFRTLMMVASLPGSLFVPGMLSIKKAPISSKPL